MTGTHRTRTKLWIAMGAAMLLAACGQGGENPTGPAGTGNAAGGTVFHRGNGAEPETLDPNVAIAKYEDDIISEMIVGLVYQDAHADPVPGAALTWETSEDGLTWTFHLREHNWSDGTPVTAEDFVYSWQRVLKPETASRYAYFIYVIKNAQAINTGAMAPEMLGAHATDAHTLVVELEHPVPYLLEMLTHVTMLPVPQHVVEQLGNAWTRAGNYVGNGPYVLTEWIPNDHITLRKNPTFYEADQVAIDEVVYYPTQDYDAALRRFRAGELDYQSRLPAGSIDFVRQNMPEVLSTAPQFTIDFVALNQSRAPFDDVRIRRALSLALDRETIVNTIRRVGELPAYSIVPPGIANYPGNVYLDFKDTPLPERIMQAQALMLEAGYGPDNPLQTELAIRSTSADARRVPAAIQQMWREIYVNLEIAQMDTAIFYNRAEEHDFDLAMAAWGADFDDASNFLDLLRSGNSNNYGLYGNAMLDTLMDQALTELDLGARGQMLAQAETIALGDMAWLPVLFWVNTGVVQTYVGGWAANPTDTHRMRWVTLDIAARSEMFPNQ